MASLKVIWDDDMTEHLSKSNNSSAPSTVGVERCASDPLYSDRTAAQVLGCGRSTLWRWAAEGVIPKPLKIGGVSRWKLSDLQAVIEKAEAQRQAA